MSLIYKFYYISDSIKIACGDFIDLCRPIINNEKIIVYLKDSSTSDISFATLPMVITSIPSSIR